MDDEAFWRQQQKVMMGELDGAHATLLDHGVDQATRLGFAQTFELVDETVLKVAGVYADDWWTQISGTTRKNLREAIQANIQTGAPLKSLVKDIEPMFGRKRAESIAATETTRMYAKGNMMAYKSDGVKQVQWKTVNDSRVDPLCESRHNQVYEIDSSFEEPPIHPSCRCWLAPIPPGKTQAITKEIEK